MDNFIEFFVIFGRQCYSFISVIDFRSIGSRIWEFLLIKVIDEGN